MAAAVGRERAGAARALLSAARLRLHAAGEGDGGLALARLWQARWTATSEEEQPGVHGEARSAQPEGVGDAVGQQGAGGAGEGVRAGRLGAAAGLEGGVVVEHGADEDADVRMAQCRGRHARVLQGLPGEFEQQPLLGVGGGGLPRGEPEERLVEGVDGVEEAAEGRAVGGQVGPASGRRRGDGVGAGGQEVPELLGTGRAGQPAGHADDRHGLVLDVGRTAGTGCRPNTLHSFPTPCVRRLGRALSGRSPMIHGTARGGRRRGIPVFHGKVALTGRGPPVACGRLHATQRPQGLQPLGSPRWTAAPHARQGRPERPGTAPHRPERGSPSFSRAPLNSAAATCRRLPRRIFVDARDRRSRRSPLPQPAE